MENLSEFAEMTNLMSLVVFPWNVSDEAEEKLLELRMAVTEAGPETIVKIQKGLIFAIDDVLRRCTDNTNQEKRLKRIVTDILQIYLVKTKINSLKVFFFVYGFLLREIYDHKQSNCVAKIEEEYKLAIMQTMVSLAKALTGDAAKKLYTRENALKLCEMLYVTIEMAKSEQFRSLRLASIECIMSLSKIDGTVETSDVEIRNQIADVFMFFAPGIIEGLSAIATEDEKRGHNVALLAIRAWGRFLALQMQDYEAAGVAVSDLHHEKSPIPQTNWKNKDEIEEYLDKSRRTSTWYKSNDARLRGVMPSIAKLTRHSHPKVRLELAHSSSLLVKYCSSTIPDTVSKIIEILIMLSEDDDNEVAALSKNILSSFSSNLTSPFFKTILENLEENFFATVTALPRIFSGLDEQEQLSSLNLLIGYLRLFGKTNLKQLLHSTTHVQRLIQTLIHICELDRKDVGLFEEYMIQDLELVVDYRTPWKNYRYFRNDAIKIKLEAACSLFAQCDTLDVISDLLIDIFMNYEEIRKEATLILNSVLAGISGIDEVNKNIHIIKNIANIYLDPEYWNLTLEVSHTCLMPQVQNNVVQICLQVEGLSTVALVMKRQFQPFLLKALYPVLERAGAGHPLIKAAGITAIVNISVACGYANVTELINTNSNYFSFHVMRKIHRIEENESVLNVLTTVMRYSNIDVLQSISEIVFGVLLQTCDKFFQERIANPYLRLFHMFIKSLIRWLSVEVHIEPIKSKRQKEAEHEDFQISNLSGDHDGVKQSAQEIFTEGMENLQEETCDEPWESYVKPVAPDHIRLVVQLLQRSLNFLPSKDRSRKLLVLEILKDGVELIRSWEDELLPLVHQIWSPLIGRFKEKDDLLIISRSFDLFVTLARLSKDFIRSRTTQNVLPQVTEILKNLAKSSYLQDRGSAYRYTQAYKMQLNVLQQLARAVIDLDLPDVYIVSTLDTVMPYLSNKQPIPLQEAAIGFYRDLTLYDEDLVGTNMQKHLREAWLENNVEYIKNLETALRKDS